MRYIPELALTAVLLLLGACSSARLGTEYSSTPCNGKMIAGILNSSEAPTRSEAVYLRRCGIR